MRIVLSSIGSRGDVQPMVVLATALMARGHEVVLCAPPNAEDFVTSRGVDFVAVGIDLQAYIQEQAQRGMGLARILRDFARIATAQMESAARILNEVMSRTTDRLVSAGVDTVGSSVAEALGIQSHYVFYTPTLFPSKDFPPAFFPLVNAPHFTFPALWQLSRRFLNAVWLPKLNRVRTELGLNTIKEFFLALPEHGIMAYEPEIAPLPSDAHETITESPMRMRTLTQTGFLRFCPDDSLDDNLTAWLDAGPPPIYVGFGSMADPRPDQTAGILDALAQRTGQRILWCRGWTAGSVTSTHRDVFVIERAPHHMLFPKCSVIVHHGGAGTTQTALLAGVPQVVVSFAVDQPYWGQRTHRIGVGGKPITRRRLNINKLHTSVLEAQQCQSKASAVAQRASTHDGVAETIALIEGRKEPSLMRGVPVE